MVAVDRVVILIWQAALEVQVKMFQLVVVVEQQFLAALAVVEVTLVALPQRQEKQTQAVAVEVVGMQPHRMSLALLAVVA
jgi:hypothetical protein